MIPILASILLAFVLLTGSVMLPASTSFAWADGGDG